MTERAVTQWVKANVTYLSSIVFTNRHIDFNYSISYFMLVFSSHPIAMLLGNQPHLVVRVACAFTKKGNRCQLVIQLALRHYDHILPKEKVILSAIINQAMNMI